jgi:hypothetical protein
MKETPVWNFVTDNLFYPLVDKDRPFYPLVDKDRPCYPLVDKENPAYSSNFIALLSLIFLQHSTKA